MATPIHILSTYCPLSQVSTLRLQKDETTKALNSPRLCIHNWLPLLQPHIGAFVIPGSDDEA